MEKDIGMPHVLATKNYATKTKNGKEYTICANEELILLKESGDKRYVQTLRNGNERIWVPGNVVVFKHNIKNEEFFCQFTSRKDAEQRVLDSGLCDGAFLIRKSTTIRGFYVLTLRDDSSGNPKAVHYKINTSQRQCRLDKSNVPESPKSILEKIENVWTKNKTSDKSFDTISSLVEYYKENKGVLSRLLTFPASLIPPRNIQIQYDTSIHWNVYKRSLEWKENLGDGYFGEVSLQMWNKHLKVAVKTYKEGKMDKNEFRRESDMMIRCNHERIVKIYAISFKEEPFYIISEFLPGGSLLKLLERMDKNGEKPSLQCFVHWATQIAQGMEYLEEMKIVHRDLAARNVLVEENEKNVKIGDLGLARRLQDNGTYRVEENLKLDLEWQAPECSDTGFSNKTDQWSYGILLQEMFTLGKIKTNGTFDTKCCLLSPDPVDKLPRPELCPEEIYNDVILTCWSHSPKNRPTFAHLHKFLTDYKIVTSTDGAAPE